MVPLGVGSDSLAETGFDAGEWHDGRDRQMAVRVAYDEDQCQLVVQVACKDVSSDREIASTFNDLDTALGKIDEKLDSDIPFFLIDMQAKGARSGPGEFKPYEDDGEYHLGSRNPWEVFCPPF